MTVSNGNRAVLHQTGFQDLLLKLGFRRLCCGFGSSTGRGWAWRCGGATRGDDCSTASRRPQAFTPSGLSCIRIACVGAASPAGRIATRLVKAAAQGREDQADVPGQAVLLDVASVQADLVRIEDLPGCTVPGPFADSGACPRRWYFRLAGPVRPGADGENDAVRPGQRVGETPEHRAAGRPGSFRRAGRSRAEGARPDSAGGETSPTG